MNQERKFIFDPRTAGTIAANLFVEGGTAGNPLTQKPEIAAALSNLLLSLGDLPAEKAKEMLLFLSQNNHRQKR